MHKRQSTHFEERQPIVKFQVAYGQGRYPEQLKENIKGRLLNLKFRLNIKEQCCNMQ